MDSGKWNPSSGCASGAFYPVSHPADAGDFLNKTKNTDLPQAEGGLSSFGKNCKQRGPLKTVLLHTAREQSGSKTHISQFSAPALSNTEHMTV